MVESALRELIESVPGMQYFNFDFVDYCVILPVKSERNDASFMSALALGLYKIMSPYFEINIALFKGRQNVMFEDLDAVLINKHTVMNTGLNRAREVLKDKQPKHLFLEPSIAEQTFYLEHMPLRPDKLGRREQTGDVEVSRIAGIEEVTPRKIELMKQLSDTFENIPDEYSRKIRSYLNNIGKAVKESKKYSCRKKL